MEVTPTSAVVQTDEPLSPGDRVLVRLSFPGLLEPFELEAHAVSRRLPAGPGEPAGVTFVFVFASEAEEERLRRLLAGDLGEPGPADPAAEGPLEDAAPPRADPPYRVLVVEDSPITRDTLLFGARKHFRGRTQLALAFADSAEQAWEMLQASRYELVIVDHFLPGMQGADLVARVRSDPHVAGIPIVGISTGGDRARELLLGAGADVFLEKPLVVRDLVSSLERLVSLAGPVQRRRILVVDDSVLFLDVTRAVLEQAGYSVLCASSLADVERLTSARPDLVLMDVQMPEAYGDDVAMVMRAMRRVHVPIYLLSSLEDDELTQRASEAEIEGFISKRQGPEHLVDRVRAILGERP
jgi:CheY-like chemotaxis protein